MIKLLLFIVYFISFCIYFLLVASYEWEQAEHFLYAVFILSEILIAYDVFRKNRAPLLQGFAPNLFRDWKADFFIFAVFFGANGSAFVSLRFEQNWTHQIGYAAMLLLALLFSVDVFARILRFVKGRPR